METEVNLEKKEKNWKSAKDIKRNIKAKIKRSDPLSNEEKDFLSGCLDNATVTPSGMIRIFAFCKLTPETEKTLNDMLETQKLMNQKLELGVLVERDKLRTDEDISLSEEVVS